MQISESLVQAAPLAAVLADVTMPAMLVPAPSRTDPISASPRPVRSAITSASPAILVPSSAMTSAVPRNMPAMAAVERLAISGRGQVSGEDPSVRWVARVWQQTERPQFLA